MLKGAAFSCLVKSYNPKRFSLSVSGLLFLQHLFLLQIFVACILCTGIVLEIPQVYHGFSSKVYLRYLLSLKNLEITKLSFSIAIIHTLSILAVCQALS